MRKLLTVVAFLLVALPAHYTFSQVDTSFIYNQGMPYGTLDIRIAKSATRYYYLQEDVTFSFRESAPGVKTNTYLDMTAWDSSPYAEGNLREKNGDADDFVMNYRLLKPVDYNSTLEKGYPLIIMLHGSGEKGNCWNSNCYHADTSYDPVVNNPAAPTSADHELLNNDHNLLHGGKVFLDAVNLAGNKLPDDPTLDARAFPGFVLFPQSLNGWNGNAVQDALRLLRLVIKKYNIDEDRIYINGLSNGGHGAYEAIKRAPWMFSAAILMSAVDDGFIINAGMESSIAGIPLWIFQGALDTTPTPNKTKYYINRFRSAGSVIRYTEYPDVGHTTWNRAFKEPEYFSWMLGENKASVHVFAGSAKICSGSGSGLPLQLPEGLRAYQWEKNGQIIEGANAAEYIATAPGSYRARFSRISATPAEADWNEWSPVVEVSEQQQPVASIRQVGTVLLKDLNNGNVARLEAAEQAAHYYWYKNGALLNLPGNQDDTLSFIEIQPGACASPCSNNGAYTLVASMFDNCQSAPSEAKHVFFSDQAPVNIEAPGSFTGSAASSSSIQLQWTDNASDEIGYEIWRRKKLGDSQFGAWEMPTLTAANATTFIDEQLEPESIYQYKIRAAGVSGRSEYTPSGTSVLEVSTVEDSTPPTAPGQLSVTRKGLDRVYLVWSPATDDSGIREYMIAYNGQEVSTGSADTVYMIEELAIDSSYNFFVKARDLAGNEGEPSNTVSVTMNVAGLFYEHSPGYWPSLDSIDWSMPEYTGFVDNFTLSEKTQEDYFYFRFDGFLYIETDGSYRFRVTSDDGARLYINNQLVADNNGIHKLTVVESESLSLTAGANRITVNYFESTHTDSLQVEYAGPDTNDEWMVIPSSALRSSLVIANEPTVNSKLIVNVFPNPASQNNMNIQVESLLHERVSVRLFDSFGKEIVADEFDIGEIRQGVRIAPQSRLNHGMYIIRVRQGGHVIQQKVLITEK